MIISLAGYPGSGKSTVGRILAERLRYSRYSLGDLQRKLAKEHGMTLAEWHAVEEEDDTHDRQLDAYQTKLGVESDDFIIDGRMSWHFIPHSLKVFLDVSPSVGASRIYSDAINGNRPNENKYESEADVVARVRERVKSENTRYQEYYGLNWDDKGQFDLVIDTTDLTPEAVAEKIIDKLA